METSFNLRQLHEKFDVSVRTWREYIKRKELRAFKIGRTYHVFEQDLKPNLLNPKFYIL
jgi:hypothetical protein